MKVLRKVFASLGLITLLSFPQSTFSQESSPQETQDQGKTYSHAKPSEPQVEIGFHLNFAYTLPKGYTLNFKGLQKDNSTWRWSLADNEFYYEHVPIRATFDSVNGFNTDYRELITIDGKLLGDVLTASPAQLQETWERSYQQLRDALEDIFIPSYVWSFTDGLASKLRENMRGHHDWQSNITVDGYSRLPKTLIDYTQEFYAAEVSPEDKKKTEDAWNNFRQQWRETLPKLDQDALLVHPLQKIKIGTATLEDWLTLFQGGLELLQVRQGDNFVSAYATFFGEGKAQNEIFYRSQLQESTFTHLISTTAWMRVRGHAYLGASFAKGVPVLELAQLDGLFSDLEAQHVEIPDIRAWGRAGFDYKKSLTLGRVFESRMDTFSHPDILGVDILKVLALGILDSNSFYNDEWGLVAATAALDTEKRELRASYLQLWNRQQWRTQTQLSYLYAEGTKNAFSGMATVGMLAETELRFSQQRKAVFEGYVNDEGRYDSAFTYQNWVDYIPSFRLLPRLNILGEIQGKILTPMLGCFLYPEQRVLLGGLLELPHFSSFLTMQLQFGKWQYALPGQEEKIQFHSENFLALDEETQEAYRHYMREQQRLLVLPRLEKQQELLREKAKVYRLLNGLALLGNTENDQLAVELVWGFPSSLFVSAGYETTFQQEREKQVGTLLLGSEDFLLSGKYGRHAFAKKYGEEYLLSFALPLSPSVHFTVDFQPLYNVSQEDFIALSARPPGFSDFRLMTAVGGEW